jgi:hypothetical protein
MVGQRRIVEESMAATVIINRWTGAFGSPTKTQIDGANTVAAADDTHQAVAAGSNNPIRIPAGGTNYSYWVTTRLRCTVTPAGTINNIRWYTDGGNSFGTGITCKAQDAASYVQATGTQGTTGLQLTTGNHSGLSGAPVDAFSFTSGSPKSLAGSISNPSTGDFGDFMVYQIEVAPTAAPGVTSQETFTWVYDET